jgi:hypothetical protein
LTEYVIPAKAGTVRHSGASRNRSSFRQSSFRRKPEPVVIPAKAGIHAVEIPAQAGIHEQNRNDCVLHFVTWEVTAAGLHPLRKQHSDGGNWTMDLIATTSGTPSKLFVRMEGRR